MQWLGLTGGSLLAILAALPATVNYQLNSYGFGSGGAGSGTTTYALEGTTGEVSGTGTASATYSLKPGFVQTQQAHVPKLSALDNGSGTYYNKLHFVIDQQNNPSDALYALAISTDNFVSDTRYVKSDMTVGSSLVVADYKNYASFGGASGAAIVGLNPGTAYYVRLKATQGKYTESAYGPVSSASTVGAQLSFSTSTSTVAFGTLPVSTVTTASPSVSVTFATNASSGGDIYISSQNGGLASAQSGNSIPAVSGDLTGLTHGFGAQIASATATSGTLNKVSPYDGTGGTVGLTNTTIRRILTAGGPLVGGSASISFKAKTAPTDTAAADYLELSTMLASANF